MRGDETTVYFATGNKGKYEEAAQVAKEFDIQLKQLNFEKLEIQSNNLQEIASYAARHSAAATKRPVVVEDAGLFVQALNGFPGPYSSYVYDTIGYQGILRLMDNTSKRRAYFRAVVAFCSSRSLPNCFSGVVRGDISSKAKGKNGFGFDPIFIPLKGGNQTFAELDVTEKNLFSHRAKAFAKFFHWFTTKQ